jgi:2-polyprenyl-3-methyl-5-hydroxy-6-metoxy-1,4-benzoquinol methylase
MINKEDIKVKEAKKCLLCGSPGIILYEDLQDRLFQTPGIWSFLQCPSCCIDWLNPLPLPSELGKLYADYFTHSLSQEKKVLRGHNLLDKMRRAILAAHFGYTHLSLNPEARRWDRLVSIFPLGKDFAGRFILWLEYTPGGRLLEVGCGNGEYLKRMEDLGWDVQGVEPDTEAARIARDQHGVPVTAGRLEEADIPDNSLDAIIIQHVLEHVPNPLTLLRRCLCLLKPGGQLIILTPNLESLGHRLFNKSWVHLDPPRHFFLFSSSSLEASVKQAGFNIVRANSKVRFRFTSWTWVTSRMINLKGKYIEDDSSWTLKTTGKMFYIMEKVFRLLRKSVGEELLLIATKE